MSNHPNRSGWKYRREAVEPSEVRHGPCPCCGTEWTTHPHVPPCPPIPAIREAAREVGYAVAVHGSLKRDFDLIAAPWTDEAVGHHALVEHILKRLPELLGCGVRRIGDWERKPLGRFACTLQVDAWMKHIDISIAPRLSEPPSDAHKLVVSAGRDLLAKARSCLFVFTGEDFDVGDQTEAAELVEEINAFLDLTPSVTKDASHE